jgi:hypothetical protein
MDQQLGIGADQAGGDGTTRLREGIHPPGIDGLAVELPEPLGNRLGDAQVGSAGRRVQEQDPAGMITCDWSLRCCGHAPPRMGTSGETETNDAATRPTSAARPSNLPRSADIRPEWSGATKSPTTLPARSHLAKDAMSAEAVDKPSTFRPRGMRGKLGAVKHAPSSSASRLTMPKAFAAGACARGAGGSESTRRAARMNPPAEGVFGRANQRARPPELRSATAVVLLISAWLSKPGNQHAECTL